MLSFSRPEDNTVCSLASAVATAEGQWELDKNPALEAFDTLLASRTVELTRLRLEEKKMYSVCRAIVRKHVPSIEGEDVVVENPAAYIPEARSSIAVKIVNLVYKQEAGSTETLQDIDKPITVRAIFDSLDSKKMEEEALWLYMYPFALDLVTKHIDSYEKDMVFLKTWRDSLLNKEIQEPLWTRYLTKTTTPSLKRQRPYNDSVRFKQPRFEDMSDSEEQPEEEEYFPVLLGQEDDEHIFDDIPTFMTSGPTVLTTPLHTPVFAPMSTPSALVPELAI